MEESKARSLSEECLSSVSDDKCPIVAHDSKQTSPSMSDGGSLSGREARLLHCTYLSRESRGPLNVRWLLVFILLVGSPTLGRARLGMGAVLLTNASFQAFVRDNERVLIDFFDKTDDRRPELLTELDAGVRLVRDAGCSVPVGKVDTAAEEDLAERYVPTGRLPQLLWFLHGEPTTYHRSLRTAKSISDFIMALDRDPITIVHDANEVQNYNKVVFARTKLKSPLYKALEVVALKHLDTIAFLVQEDGEDKVKYITDDADPVQYEGQTIAADLEKWVLRLLIKSESPPERPAVEGEPVIVVGKTLEQLVFRKDRDVFLLVHAPWCGHSRKVFPVWEILARAAADVKHLVVAKMDGDRNSSPLPDVFYWEAFPTIFFVKAGERKPMIFHGNRTLGEFVRFANEHGSAPFTIDDAAMQEEESLSEL